MTDKFKLEKKHYIFFGIFFSLFLTILIIQPIPGDDYWWHVKIGEWIIKNKKIPMMGIYSWYGLENNLNWFAHEWLAEVVLYGFSLLFGKNLGGLVYLFMCLILLGTLLYCFNFKDYLKNLPCTCIWMVIGFVSVATVCTARPHMFTLSLFTILIHICERMKKGNKNIFYFFLPLTIIWANYHGGSSNITYIIPFIYFITNTFTFKFGRIMSRKIKKSYHYLIFAILNFFALLINPRIHQLWLYPYSYTNEHAKYISEWKSPSFTNGGYALLVIIVICLIFFITKKTIEFSDLALVGIFMLLTLKSIRFDVWLYIVGTMVLAKYIKELEDKTVYKFLCYEFMGLGILFFLFSCYSVKKGDAYITESIPQEVIEILKEEQPKRLMNFYDYGSYLVYEEIPVFIDGRADMYSGFNFKQAAEGLNYNPDYTPEEFITEFNFDMYLLPENFYFTHWLKEQGYEVLYEDRHTDTNKGITLLKP